MGDHLPPLGRGKWSHHLGLKAEKRAIMKPLENIIAAAKRSQKRIVLSEGEDPRIAAAAIRIVEDGLAHPILIGNHASIAARITEHGGDPSAFEIIDPRDDSRFDAYEAEYFDLRKNKGMDRDTARQAMATPLVFAAMMVRCGDADGTVGGAVHTTGDTVRAALQIIGRAPGVKIVSSFFLMMLCEHHHSKKGGFVFADCGLVVEPNTSELADIALSSARSFEQLIHETPRVAMLSFSTRGSAVHERVDRVIEAARLVQQAAPELAIDGDLQFDAAFIPAVSKAKAPDSVIGGTANVLIFPNLEAANIGYKIAQRIGGAKAIGPILQGLAKPANDLSRGCDIDDIYHLVAVTCVQAEGGNVP
jgi:phosphate acetyltransferase